MMNLISILRRSRPGLSSSSSSSSAVCGRWRFIPRLSPDTRGFEFAVICSSSADGEAWSCWSVRSAIVSRRVGYLRYDDDIFLELRADLT